MQNSMEELLILNAEKVDYLLQKLLVMYFKLCY